VSAQYRSVGVKADERHLVVKLDLFNASRRAWTREQFFIGWQLFDPDTNRFIREGEWNAIPSDVAGGGSLSMELALDFPPEPGGYRIYISPIEGGVWDYAAGAPFLIVDAEIAQERLLVRGHEIATKRTLRWRGIRRAIPKAFQLPLATVFRNQRLIRSMVRRDILARYRGSFGDALWTILNPLLLMSTYFFVFGVVLRSRYGADSSLSGFALYLLAGMLPWLAFSEPVGRAPQVVLEHRNFVKKLIFPLETLPVNQVASGFVTEMFALSLFLIALVVFRGGIPGTIVWLPVVMLPQILFTLGLCWFLAGLGAFLRDLGQIMGFVLNLWFFLTPICYLDTTLSKTALAILGKNPMYILVRGYRAVLLEHRPPETLPMLKMWVLAVVVFLAGHAWFYKLRKMFADVI
jgi:lipopolysaccharide transport system permease protein